MHLSNLTNIGTLLLNDSLFGFSTIVLFCFRIQSRIPHCILFCTFLVSSHFARDVTKLREVWTAFGLEFLTSSKLTGGRATYMWILNAAPLCGRVFIAVTFTVIPSTGADTWRLRYVSCNDTQALPSSVCVLLSTCVCCILFIGFNCVILWLL